MSVVIEPAMSTMTTIVGLLPLVLIPGAGHLPNLEQPEAFGQALRDFLEQFYED